MSAGLDPDASRGYLSVDELAELDPLPATAEAPEDVQRMLRSDLGLFVRSDAQPALDVATEEVPGAPGFWRVVDRSGQLRTVVPGQEQAEADPDESARGESEPAATEAYRPPWAEQHFLPRLVPFRSPEGPRGHTYLEPRAPRPATAAEAQEAPHVPYPWRTVGRVFSTGGPSGPESGSGVLVGPNLMLTASHVAPWGSSNWSMEFVPGMRFGERPFGSSFVREFRGYRTEPEVSGKDYVVCRLYQPLGNALGWMGGQSWGDEDEYYRRRFTSSGYPGTFGGRPAVEHNIAVVDIDNDSPGLEVEVSFGHPLTAGWSGGPLWFFAGQSPMIVGVLSGSEKDEFDPRRHVFAAGRGFVDLIKFGLANWPP
ncbi:MAG TPA: hypothetical protein VHF89_07280 [Solirubrobacteraceae bacterium]|nr:hypothetical protein [Solirubrobacteraceae bacterium]